MTSAQTENPAEAKHREADSFPNAETLSLFLHILDLGNARRNGASWVGRDHGSRVTVCRLIDFIQTLSREQRAELGHFMELATGGFISSTAELRNRIAAEIA